MAEGEILESDRFGFEIQALLHTMILDWLINLSEPVMNDKI